MAEKMTMTEASRRIFERLDRDLGTPSEEEQAAKGKLCGDIAAQFEAQEQACQEKATDVERENCFAGDAYRDADAGMNDCGAEMFFFTGRSCLWSSIIGTALLHVKESSDDGGAASCLMRDRQYQDGTLIERACIDEEEFETAQRIAAHMVERLTPEAILACADGRLSADQIAGGLFAVVAADVEREEEQIEEMRQIAEIVKVASLDDVAALDLNGDGGVELAEAAAFAVTRADWLRFAHVLEPLGVRHPIDLQDLSPEDVARAREIAARVEAEIGISRDDPNFCNAFRPKFVEAGTSAFAEGGLCFASDEPRTMSIDEELASVEMTAAESFAVCRDPNQNYGSCSERMYMVEAALAATGVPCSVESRMTENHVYPASEGKSLDPIGIGEIGWSREVNPVAMYLSSLASSQEDGSFLHRVAHFIDPEGCPDYSSIRNHLNSLKLISSDASASPEERAAIIDAIIEEVEPSVEAIPERIALFNYFSDWMQRFSPEVARELGMAVVTRFPNNPHAILPLIMAMGVTGMQPVDEEERVLSRAMIERNFTMAAGELKEKLPFSGWAETMLAQRESVLGHKADAIAYAERALMQNPRNALMLKVIAFDEVMRSQYDAAESLLSDAMEVAPNLPGSHATLTTIAQVRGDLDRAAVEAGREATVYWRNPMGAFLKIDLELMKGNPRMALRWFGNVRSERANDPRSISLARAKAMMGHYEEAISVLDRQIEYHPRDMNARLFRTSIALEMNDLDAAREQIDRIDAAQHPEIRRSLQQQLWWSENDIASLEASLFDAIETPGTDPAIVSQLERWLAFARGNFDDARMYCEKAIAANPYDWGVEANMVGLDITEADTVEKVAMARARFEELRARFPDVYQIRTVEPSLLLREERFEEALVSAEAVLARMPMNINASNIKAHALIALGRPEEALGIGEALAQRAPKQPAGCFIQARAYFAMGDIANAQAMLAKTKAIQVYDIPQWPLFSTAALEAEIAAGMSAKP